MFVAMHTRSNHKPVRTNARKGQKARIVFAIKERCRQNQLKAM